MAIGVILAEGVLSVYAYSQNVRLDHELRNTERTIGALRISTADFKSQMYATMDPQNVDTLAAKLGLTKERKPEYLSVNR